MNINFKTYLTAALVALSASVAMGQTSGGQSSPPGPFQMAPQTPQMQPRWNNVMPMPYWMQKRPQVGAPRVGNSDTNTVQAPVYPQPPQVNLQRQPQFRRGWGWTPFNQGQRWSGYQYPQGGNQNFGGPGQYYGQMPSFVPNGPWNGFFGQSNPIYGYQPAYPAPAAPRR